MSTKKPVRLARPRVPELQERLRSVGLRSTAPRVAVLRQLQRATRPVSHAELVERLDGEGLDRVTLYRNLNDLAEAGLLARTDLGDHTWRFELRPEGAPHALLHPHFTCTRCGTVTCLPEDAVQLSRGRGLPAAVSRRAVEVTLRGQCDRCGVRS
jgi:Fur family ferric uptake transcriptional regulator